MSKVIKSDELSDFGLFDVDTEILEEAGAIPKKQRVNVQEVISEVVEDYSHLGAGKMIQKELSPRTPYDPSMLLDPPPVRIEDPTPKAAARMPQTITEDRQPDFATPKNLPAVGTMVDGVYIPPEQKVQAPEPAPEPTPTPEVKAPVDSVKTEVSEVKVEKAGRKKNDLKQAVPVKDVMILRPVLRDVHSLVHHATLALYDRNSFGYDAQQGDAVVYHSRNMLADRFMKSDYEWALWWDDDVVPPIGNEGWSRAAIQSLPSTYPGQFLRINPIQRLKSHGKTIIGGLYFGRKSPWTAICHRTSQTASSFKNVPRAEISAVDWVGTGFLLVHRSVFEAIQASHPELAPKSGAANDYEKVWNYFQPDHQQGEDVSFCKRAKGCGHQPFVDLSVVCTHVGDYCFGPWNQR